MLIIHIGTHKTGTSALQGVLTRNSDRLLEHGIGYVRSGRHGAHAHHELARALRKRSDKSIWQKAREELAESTSAIDLISSEGFWFCDPAQLKEQLPKDKEIKIVAYLRRQDRYLQSLYKQAAVGGRKLDFVTWLGEMHHRGNYFSIIERWEAQFGRNAITLRPYDRDGRTIDLIEDFGLLLGCDLVDQRRKGKVRGNASPRRELLHFIRAFNKLDLEVDREHFFYTLIHKNSDYIRSADLLTASESVSLMREYEEENRLLVEKYYDGSAGTLFPEMQNSAPPPHIWELDDGAFLDLTADFIEIIVKLTTEGKIRIRPDPAEPGSAAPLPDSPRASGDGSNRQTRHAAGKSRPKRKRQ